MPYGPAERLQEQVSILVTEATPTAIVQLSLLGEPAVPHLLQILSSKGSNRRTEGSTEELNAIVRALGMIASPKAVTALAKRFHETEQPYYHSSSDGFRITANALRKIGTAEAFDALRVRLKDFEIEHASATFGAFGEEGMKKVVALLKESTGDEFAFVVQVVTRWQRPDAVPLLLERLNSADRQDACKAAYGLCRNGSVPPQPLFAAFDKLAQRWVAQEGEIEDDDEPDLYNAVLAAVYHSQGVEAVPHLLKWAAVEYAQARKHGLRHRRRLRDAILSFGPAALPHVKAHFNGHSKDVEAVAVELAHKIHEGEEGEAPEVESASGGRMRR